MATVHSITGAGAGGSIGLVPEGDGERRGAIILRFDAFPWQEQPAASGSVTMSFHGNGPKRAVALDGWATLDPHLGQQTIINWTAPTPPEPGSVRLIWYDEHEAPPASAPVP